MRYKLLTYSFFVFVLLVTSCVEFADCSKKELFTDVQEKKVSVNIFVDQSDEVIQFNWYFSDGFSKATTEPIVEHTLIQNGEYSVEVEVEKTNGDVCSYDGFFLIHDETSVEDTCDIDISALEINGSYLTAKVSLDGGVDGAEFCWNTGDGFSLKSTSNEFFYEYPQSGVFNFVVGYNRGACKDSAKKVVTVEPIDVEIPCSVVLDSLPQFIGKTVYLKVEQLDIDFSKMCQKLKLNYSLLHFNEASKREKSNMINNLINSINILVKMLKNILYIIFNQSLTKETLLSMYQNIFNRIKYVFIRRPLPSAIDIWSLIQEDNILQQRIYNLYEKDFDLYFNN